MNTITSDKLKKFLYSQCNELAANLCAEAVISAETIKANTHSDKIKNMEPLDYIVSFSEYRIKNNGMIIDKECSIVFTISNMRQNIDKNYKNMMLLYLLYSICNININVSHQVILKFEKQDDLFFTKEKLYSLIKTPNLYSNKLESILFDIIP